MWLCHEQFELQENAIKPAAVISLPFQCTHTFYDLFVLAANNYPGYGLQSYPLAGDGNRRFHVLHVSVQGVAQAWSTHTGDYAEVPW